MIKEYVRVLREQITEEIMNNGEHLQFGRCRNYDEYKYLTGLIQGLRLAEEKVIALAKRIETDDE